MMSKTSFSECSSYRPFLNLLKLLRSRDNEYGGIQATLSLEEWKALVEVARRQEVLPLLYRWLKQLKVDPPKVVEEELERAYIINALHNSIFLMELERILKGLAQNSIQVILLKGAYLLLEVYKDLGLRRMGDIDILVHKEDLAAAHSILLGLGYQSRAVNPLPLKRWAHYEYFNEGNGVLVEVHWNLLEEYQPVKIDTEILWHTSCIRNLNGIPFHILSPEINLLHLCLHAAKHVDTLSLRFLYDIYKLVETQRDKLKWSIVESFARKWRIYRPVTLFMRLTDELLGLEPSLECSDLLKQDSVPSYYYSLAKMMLISNLPYIDVGEPALMRIFFTKGVGRKLSLLWRALIPSKEEMSNLYGTPPSFIHTLPYYLVRWTRAVLHLLKTCPIILQKLVRNSAEFTEQLKYMKAATELHDWLLLAR
jgi:hypothetical protein